VRTSAAESEAEVVVLRSRLDARDATLTALQQHAEQLEALQGPAPPEPDDLGLIDGVGRLVERMLHEAGITTYRQLALLSDKADGSDARLAEFLARIRREEWADQARDLHKRKYGEELSVG
jgi:predicted flap endonuclease-1-like 5' DNA nuclease